MQRRRRLPGGSADATAFEAPKLAVMAGAVVVDHGLQPGSGDVAHRTGLRARRWGSTRSRWWQWRSTRPGWGPRQQPGRPGMPPSSAAAARLGADLVLLGHTRDDQAEQVLLASPAAPGARFSSPVCRPAGARYARPLLGLSRAQTTAACAAHGLEPWADPHNDDPAYARVRARAVLPALEAALGPGVAAALARTADRLREDADHLDAEAAAAAEALGEGPIAAADLLALPRAVRTRLWRLLVIAAARPRGRSCSPTSRPATPSSPGGTGRARSTCPAGSRSPGRTAGCPSPRPLRLNRQGHRRRCEPDCG